MAIKSCGILLYRQSIKTGETEVFLIRANTPNSTPELWGVPKGRMEKGERPLQTAKREFREETGTTAPELNYVPLPGFVTKRGKIITVFTADAGDSDIQWVRKKVAFSTFLRNGTERSYRETRDGRWFTLSDAAEKIGEGQKGILDTFLHYLHKNVYV
jgi:predicted NUDIX family NTP pyrophosphohydrolase